MAGTYTQLYIQIVFAVQGRRSLIQTGWEHRLHQYITAIVQSMEQKMLAINGMPDHIHFFLGLKPSCCISDLVREVKKSSNKFVNENGLTKYGFNWQEGYGAFSYSHSQRYRIINYVLNQKQHHNRTSFKDEYMGLLKAFDIEFKNEFLFEWL